jgi:RNA polymerase sigma-70 factor (ECF subfamily)
MSAEPVSVEAQLLTRISAGDESALAAFYDRFSRLVFSVAYHVVLNDTLAEEVTQDTFLKIWNRAHQWDSSRGKITTWLLTIARYTAIDRLRAEQRRDGRGQLDLEDVMNTLGENSPIDEPAWADERLMHDILNELPPDQRQVLELAYFRDMSHSEMAEQLNIPLGTIKGRVRAGLSKLRALWFQKTETEG